MKAIKMIGLAALAALMAMAFVGASSAIAESTALCKVDESPCVEANLVTEVHEASVGKAKLLTSIGTTECTALFQGNVLNTSAAKESLIVRGSFSYSSCTLGGSECTAKEENGPSEIKVLKEGHETSTVTGEGLVHLVCGKSIDCSYNGTGLVGTGKGPLLSAESNPNGEVTLSEQATTKELGGLLCPKTAKLDITTTPLTKTYISGAVKAQEMVCTEVAKGTGLYEAVGNGMTCEKDSATKKGNFELGWK